MSVVGLPLAFVPPVVVLPAASAVVPAVAGAAATAVALPVLPLVGAVVVGAGVAGAAAVAVAAVVNGQKWGYLNDRQGAAQPGNWQGPTSENVLPNSVVIGPGGSAGQIAPYVVNSDVYPQRFPDSTADGNTSVSTWWGYYPQTGPGPYGWAYYWMWQGAQGPVYGSMRVGPFNETSLDGASPGQGPQMQIAWRVVATGEPVPEAEPVYPQPAQSPQVKPEPLPAPQPAPAQPAPLPLVVPAVPDADPVAPPANPPGTPSTTPANPPATRPQAPPVPTPLPVETPTPDARPTENGALAPLRPPPPTPTPTDTHIVNGQPVKSPGPQPTPEGIAQELGRVEKKLAQLLSPKEGSAADRLGLLDDKLDLLRLLWELITSLTAGGQYTLSSPCELDEAGQRIVKTVQYDGATSAFGVIFNKLDAVADLLQEHKDLKQPICRQLPPVGQPVTVNFVQTD